MNMRIGYTNFPSDENPHIYPNIQRMEPLAYDAKGNAYWLMGGEISVPLFHSLSLISSQAIASGSSTPLRADKPQDHTSASSPPLLPPTAVSQPSVNIPPPPPLLLEKSPPPPLHRPNPNPQLCLPSAVDRYAKRGPEGRRQPNDHRGRWELE
jgi:hypothetical protein